jgi:HEAT repeat protein
VRDLVRVLLVALGFTTVALVIGLVALRVAREARERRRTVRMQALREVVLTALMGEPDEANRARSDLRGRTGPAWTDLEEQAFAMMPKIKGDSHDALVSLLVSKGAAAHAVALARSRSQVRRARGAYRLGALGQSEDLSTLLGLLRDHAFLVRRMTVRALGQVGNPLAVPPLLDALTADPRLTRDVLAALGRIGPVAAPHLRRELRRSLDEPSPDRRAALTATGLGVIGDVASVPLLVAALSDHGQPGLAAAAADALGSLGAPEAVRPLLGSVRRPDPELRVAAARALGAIGQPDVAGSLAAALCDGDHETSRAVAGALLRLGAPGREALETSASVYAAEALAVQRVRQGV